MAIAVRGRLGGAIFTVRVIIQARTLGRCRLITGRKSKNFGGLPSLSHG
jgi:hypothetical protein